MLPLNTAVIAICSISPVITTLVVVLRFYARRWQSISLKMDDWLILPALVLTTGVCVCCVIAAATGGVGGGLLGYDHRLTTDQLILWGKSVWTLLLFYTCALPVIKFSILSFYCGIFTTRPFILAAKIIAAFVSCWWIAFFLTAVFQCRPISANWSVKISVNQCFDQYSWTIAHAITNILTDIVILGLPWPIIWRLQIDKKRKIGLIGVFLLGSFACFTSIIRLIFIVIINTPNIFQSGYRDETHFIGYTFLGFSLEPCIGTICACLPILAPIFKDLSFKNLRHCVRSPAYHNSTHTHTRTVISIRHQTPASIIHPSSNGFYKIQDNAIPHNSIRLEDLKAKPDVYGGLEGPEMVGHQWET